MGRNGWAAYSDKMIYSSKEDSLLLERAVKRESKGKVVLDMGAGSGMQSEAAIKSGAKFVLACDINSGFLKEIKDSRIKKAVSDLFSKIKGKFDLIIFNPPYLPRDEREDRQSALSTTGGRLGDEIILRFLREVKNHLSKNGKILIVISSLTPKDRIMNILKNKKLKKKTLLKEKLFMEELEVWEIK